MRLIKHIIKKERKGRERHLFTIKLEDGDDIWNLYNLMNVGDLVQGKVTRKIVQEAGTTSGTFRKTFTTLLKIEEIEYDTEHESIRLKGTNTTENKFLLLNQYQAMEIWVNSTITIIKPRWDEVFEHTLKMACDPAAFSDLAIVLMEEGIGHLFLVSKHTTHMKAKIEKSIPKKKTKFGQAKANKALDAFWEKITQSIINHVNFETIKTIVLASPGYYKDEYLKHLKNELESHKYPELKNREHMFILTHSSSGFKHSIKEVLEDKIVQSKIENSMAMSEISVLNKFYEMLQNDPDRAVYGLKSVSKAVESQAVQTLLITDQKFRAKSWKERTSNIKLCEQVKVEGGDVMHFSSMHPTGQTLNDITGIAAILRFPFPGLDEEEEEETEPWVEVKETGDYYGSEEEGEEGEEKKKEIAEWDEMDFIEDIKQLGLGDSEEEKELLEELKENKMGELEEEEEEEEENERKLKIGKIKRKPKKKKEKEQSLPEEKP